MGNYIIEVGPGVGCTILMAVAGAVVVVAAAAAADKWKLHESIGRKSTAKSKKALIFDGG